MITWADLLPFMSRYEIEQVLGEESLDERFAEVLPGRDLWELVENGSARPTLVVVLEQLHGSEPMELVR